MTSSSSENGSSPENEPRRPVVGIGVIILRNHRILLGKRRNAHGAGDWSPPGGHLEFGETPEHCAFREVREETGLTIENARPGGVTNDIFLNEQKHFVTLFIIADCPDGTPELLEPDKCESWVWYDWTALPEPLFLPLRNLLQQGFNPFVILTTKHARSCLSRRDSPCCTKGAGATDGGWIVRGMILFSSF